MDEKFPEARKLTISEERQVFEELWERVALTPERIPVTDWEKVDLAKRKATHLQNPNAGSSWEAVKERISRG
jgi:putative addiction module component (TIGR02574 family)